MTFYTSEIKTGSPAEFSTPTQQLIYDVLVQREIPFTRIDSDPGITMDDCLNIDRAFGIETVKTILLTNRRKTHCWLYVTHARKPFITKDFCASLEIPRVSFADEQLMMEVLGTEHGAATPLALVRPEAIDVTFVMDAEVANRPAIVVTDGTPTCFIAISTKDINKLLDRNPILID